MIETRRIAWVPPRTVPRAASALANTRLMASRFLSREERYALEDAASLARIWKAGTDLVRDGEDANSVFVLVEGWACRYAITKSGGRQLPSLLVPGDMANLDSLLFDRFDYGVRTLTEAKVVALTCTRLLTLAEHCPGIARTFTWLALIENAILSKGALSLGRRTSRERVAHLLCELSVRLGADDGDDGKASGFPFPLTQEVMADALGLTAVHVNRTMRQLRNEGLIDLQKRVMTLPDVNRLRQLCGFTPRYLHIDPRSNPLPT